MAVLSVTDATFEREVFQSEIPVLVMLYVEWDKPSAAMLPTLDAVSKELAGRVKVAVIDIERNPMVAQSFRVQSVPLLVLMHMGQVAGHHVGALDKAGVLKLLAPVAGAAPKGGSREILPADLAQLIAQKQVVPVDIREPGAFNRYRIPGAINVPAADVESRAAELEPSDGRPRVIYGRSGEETKALSDKLAESGWEVPFLVGGFLHWEADGFEVERG